MHIDLTAGRCISKLSNLIRRRLDSFSIRNEMSGSQGRVLHFVLAQSEDVFQRDIEQEFNLRPSSATQLLKLMEKNGLIRRESMSNDARLKKIIVTERASKMREQVVEDLNALEQDLTKGIDPQELRTFFKVTDQMLRNLKS